MLTPQMLLNEIEKRKQSVQFPGIEEHLKEIERCMIEWFAKGNVPTYNGIPAYIHRYAQLPMKTLTISNIDAEYIREIARRLGAEGYDVEVCTDPPKDGADACLIVYLPEKDEEDEYY